MTEGEQNQLILDNGGLVPTIANDFRGGEVEFEDLLATGQEGLVRAARSFDPDLGEFSTWAATKIRSAIMDAIGAARAQWYPKEADGGSPSIASDSIEKIYDWDIWGEMGNAMAICETWSKLRASPEDLSILYDDIRDRRDRFAAAFISLTGAQRKLVKWVFLDDPRMPVTQAARELGISYFQATRMLKRALGVMREVITRMESNQNSGSNSANGHPSTTGRHGCAPGTVAA